MSSMINNTEIWHWGWGNVLALVLIVLVACLSIIVARGIRTLRGTGHFVILSRMLIVWAVLAVASYAAVCWLFWVGKLLEYEWVVNFVCFAQLLFATTMGVKELYSQPKLLPQYLGWGCIFFVAVIACGIGVEFGVTAPIQVVAGLGAIAAVLVFWHLFASRGEAQSSMGAG